MRRTRRARVVLLVLVLVVVAAVGGGIVAITSGPHLTPAQIAAQQERARIHRELVSEENAANAAKKLVTARLPTKVGAPAPVATEPLYKAPLPAHHVVGFIPYYTLGDIEPADMADASEIVYSSVCPAANGTISDTGMNGDCALGLADLSGSVLASIITTAHADHDRVLLSIEATDDTLIERIDAHAATVAVALAKNLTALERTYGFDGTNIDFEGTMSSDREKYVQFVKAFTADLRTDDPTGEIMLDTYAAAAAGPQSFFDPKALAPLVDAIFVFNYSLESETNASAGSPLESPVLGYSAVQSLQQYEKEVPADKLILGLPFYGFDFTTSNNHPGALASTPAPTAQPYSAIVQAGFPALCDPATETPFSLFKRDGSWHQLWFDDPVSIALKVALASTLHTAGVGAWAFGYENGDPMMLSALTGDRAPLRAPFAH